MDLLCDETGQFDDTRMGSPMTSEDNAASARTPAEEEGALLPGFGCYTRAQLTARLAVELQRAPGPNAGINASHRARLIDWILKVQEHRSCRLSTACQAVDYLDRFAAACPVPLGVAELPFAAMACLLLSAKMIESDPMLLSEVLEYADLAGVPTTQLARFELVVMGSLRWEATENTAVTFLDALLLELLNARAVEGLAHGGPPEPLRAVRRRALRLIRTTLPDPELRGCRASDVAAAALLAALEDEDGRAATAARATAAVTDALGRPPSRDCLLLFSRHTDCARRLLDLHVGSLDSTAEDGSDDTHFSAEVSPSPTSVLGPPSMLRGDSAPRRQSCLSRGAEDPDSVDAAADSDRRRGISESPTTSESPAAGADAAGGSGGGSCSQPPAPELKAMTARAASGANLVYPSVKRARLA